MDWASQPGVNTDMGNMLGNRLGQQSCRGWRNSSGNSDNIDDYGDLGYTPTRGSPVYTDPETAMKRDQLYVHFMYCFLFKRHVKWRKFCADYTVRNHYASSKMWPSLPNTFAYAKYIAEWLKDNSSSVPLGQMGYCAVEFQRIAAEHAATPRVWSPEVHWDNAATTQAFRDVVRVVLAIQSKYELEYDQTGEVNALCLSADLWVHRILPMCHVADPRICLGDPRRYFDKVTWFV